MSTEASTKANAATRRYFEKTLPNLARTRAAIEDQLAKHHLLIADSIYHAAEVLTYDEIANLLAISRPRVGQILKEVREAKGESVTE